MFGKLVGREGSSVYGWRCMPRIFASPRESSRGLGG